MPNAADLAALEAQLDDFSPEIRRRALQGIAELLDAGQAVAPEPTGAVNVHFHSFFSFNYLDYSPTRIVWEARKAGLDVAGSVDFDVLDAMDEMLEAGEIVGLRTNVALETRVFAHEFADKELSSPGEPGVLYFMGTGFTRLPEPGSEAHAILNGMRAGARARNEAMLERLRPVLAPVEIDYEVEVLPLTPSDNATERHMLAVFDAKARERYPDPGDLAAYWAERTGLAADELRALLGDTAKLRTAIRAKLMKRGGPGYVQPDPTTFPPIRDVARMVRQCDAIPCATWLDGTRAGEADGAALCDWFIGLGCRVLNIIPDRNWNLADPDDKARKVANLREIVEAGRARHLVFSVGTEMNSYGQKFVDTFAARELAPYAADFRDGAYILYAHTLLERACRKGLLSTWARETFGDDWPAANAFYLEIGRRAFPPRQAREVLSTLPEDTDPAAVLDALGSA